MTYFFPEVFGVIGETITTFGGVVVAPWLGPIFDVGALWFVPQTYRSTKFEKLLENILASSKIKDHCGGNTFVANFYLIA